MILSPAYCRRLFLLISVFISLLTSHVHAAPNTIGQTGLINMPDARVAPEGSFRVGISRFRPYSVLWSSIGIFSRVEFSARYTEVSNVEGLSRDDDNFGNFKDKSFDIKFVVLAESTYVPQIALGTQDFLGTKVFTAHYLTLNKRFGEVDFSLGYGQKRLKGVFGGIRYNPVGLSNWSFVAEFDAYDYPNDKSASISGADRRTGKGTYGVGYNWGWLGTQLSVQDGDFGFSAHLSIPLMQTEFIPKLDEPKPYEEIISRHSITKWEQDPSHKTALRAALETQGFQNVKLILKNRQLRLGISTPRITLIGRAVGRTVRTALLMAPLGLESIKVTYFTLTDLAVVSYEFTDLLQLEGFFAGKVNYGQLLESLVVEYVSPQDVRQLNAQTSRPSRDDSSSTLKVESNRDGHMVSLHKTDKSLNRFLFTPFHISTYFNDSSGALKYDWFAMASYQRYFGRGLFFNASVRATVVENVSDVVEPSNSTLPHVRTEVANYKRERGLKLGQLILNKYVHLMPRVYARLSIGVYEEMYAGGGGQILYMPKDSNWAIDTTIDWLRQRDFEGELGFRQYQTVTALLNYHYRLPKIGVTLSARIGRFLAKDAGVRLEFARRFRSGFKIGAWYTRTDGQDITDPGSVGSPYYDKGIFIQMPLNTMLTRDTRAAPTASIRPWTRDVGQEVRSPGDLYKIMEDSLLFDRPDHHLLTGFHH